MNLVLADKAISAYQECEDEATMQRLAFYRGLWAIQAEAIDFLKAQMPVAIPSNEDITRTSAAHEPLFTLIQPAIDMQWGADKCKGFAAYLVKSGSFATDECAFLNDLDWEKILNLGAITKMLVHPDTYLMDVSGSLVSEKICTTNQLPLIQWVLMSLIRTYGEAYAQPLMLAARDVHTNKEAHSLTCPVCGSAATMAVVGPTTKTDVNGRQLYCGYCATSWEFERVRCARCGSQDQSKLSYFNLEGDEAHRLHDCHVCGSYIRTVWQPELKAPLCNDVEDVVMARLDAVASTFQSA